MSTALKRDNEALKKEVEDLRERLELAQGCAKVFHPHDLDLNRSIVAQLKDIRNKDQSGRVKFAFRLSDSIKNELRENGFWLHNEDLCIGKLVVRTWIVVDWD